MASAGLQMFGIFLATVGFLGDIIVCALPMWKVTAFIGSNIVTAQVFWEGLWMNCVKQSTGQMQCKVYDSMLALPQDLQAARAMVVISILLALMGLLLAAAGGKCTNCIEDELAKSRVAIAAGVFVMAGGILCLIPVSWSGHVVIRDFYNPVITNAQRRELGSVIMVSAGKQMFGLALAAVGFLGSIIICALPMWKVTAFIGANIVTAQVIWEGLWMNCVTQSTGQMQCKVYDSMLALQRDLQASRALVVIAIIAGAFGILLGVVGGKCTSFVEDERQKCKVAIAAGVVFLTAGVLVLVPVCWTANTIIRDFYNPVMTNAQRRELGAALYIGWGSAGLLLLGGGLLCSSCPRREETDYDVKYSKARSVDSSRAYV
ncbi:claudin-4-like [Nerophis lumbriciformis]|uniref:claudin-4-like n=1 Tax=Nerophis lumbriciformis TaxID=546530 RepID=UPI002ADFDA49|nr:claudin-4-like [Nerophis lumbriciformis]